MSKENNSKNIYQIPETQFSSELQDSHVDYIDLISNNNNDVPNLKIDIDLAAFDLNEDESRQPTAPIESVVDFTHSDHFRRSIERKTSKESLEVLEITNDLEKNRSEFLVSGRSLDTVKNGLIKTIFGGNLSRKAVTMDQLMAEEARVGSTIFGETPGVRTVFFNGTPNTANPNYRPGTKSWFFYQETANKKDEKNSVTLHYEVSPQNILRIKDKEISGCEVKGEELDNFLSSVRMYHEQVMSKIYKKQSYSGQRAA